MRVCAFNYVMITVLVKLLKTFKICHCFVVLPASFNHSLVCAEIN